MKEFIKLNWKYYIFIIVIAIMIGSPLFIKGLPIAHDAIYPVTRTLGTAISLSEGQVPPLVTSNFANGFGFSWNLFYPPVSTYLMLILKVFTFSYANALKALVILSIIISGMAIYNLMREITDSKKVALIAAVFYMAAPYRLTDIYIRMAIGEILAFCFIPIVFLGLYNLFEKDGKKHWYITIGAVGLLLTHNISTLLTIMIVAIYVLYNIKKLKDIKILKKILVNIIFICLIVSFFYVPLMEAKLSADYAVFEYGKMGSTESVKQNSVYLFQLLFGKMQSGSSYPLSNPENVNKDMCLSLGLFLVIPILCTPFIYQDIKKEKRGLYLLTLLTGIGLTICVTSIFPWEKMPSIVAMIQHPFRLILIITFLFTIIATINISKIVKKVEYKHVFVMTLITLVYVQPLIANTANIDINFSEKIYYEIDAMEEGQEASPSCAYYEYLPTKAEQNKDYIANRNQEAIVLEGEIEIENQKKENGKFECEYTKNSEEVRIELPYIYYPGYSVKINDQEIQTYESENGFLEIQIKNEEKGRIKVKYEGTILSKVTWGISIISTLIFIVIVLIDIRRRNKNAK